MVNEEAVALRNPCDDDSDTVECLDGVPTGKRCPGEWRVALGIGSFGIADDEAQCHVAQVGGDDLTQSKIRLRVADPALPVAKRVAQNT